ncbi:BQ2448_680 [Microbotryum intermedium]|uniref:BQ2448_680 protein n=1 Tax=Microbotryum intermedium TaxID=269621 RepID=A0A238F737_9BASI|nr:BQ2448_680 [Microbotryum intermedium]
MDSDCWLHTGPKPCSGTKIGKAKLRFGTVVDIMGRTSFQWRHWGCLTETVLANVKNSFEDLTKEDQDRVKKAYETGRGEQPLLQLQQDGLPMLILRLSRLLCELSVAPEDVPESAKVKDEDGDESPDEEGRPAKEGHSSPKKKKAPAPKAKSKKVKAEDDEDSEQDKPNKKKAAAPAKKRTKKEGTPEDDSEEEAEAVSTDEDHISGETQEEEGSQAQVQSQEGRADSPAPTLRKPSSRRTANKVSMKEEDTDGDDK